MKIVGYNPDCDNCRMREAVDKAWTAVMETCTHSDPGSVCMLCFTESLFAVALSIMKQEEDAK